MNNRFAQAALAVCLLLQLHLVYSQPINWDEFRFLADVHSYERGELSPTLLTFHVHFFGWLRGIGDEIDQVRAARVVMLLFEAGTLLLIWASARRFFGGPPAIFAALGYASFSFVLQHGASFRFDPIVTFLVMLSVWLLLRDRLRWSEMAVVGLTLAAAAMITVKVVLALPLVAAIGTYRLLTAECRGSALARLAFAAASSLSILALLYAWHVSTLAPVSGPGAEANLSASYQKTLAEIPFFPRRIYFLRGLIENPLHWFLLLLGIAAVARSYRENRPRALLVLAFLLPLLSIITYRNAFPYYYAFVMAPAAVLFGAAAARPELGRFLGLASAALAGGAVLHHQLALSPAAQEQRRTIRAVHAIFPRPVPYIDRCSMIASFPQAGFFMSSWGLEAYRNAARPIMREVLAHKHPLFVIVDSPLLSDALDGTANPEGWRLFEADRRVLRANFVHHWGPIWVAGKQLTAQPREQEIEFLIPGLYRLEVGGPVRFDGRLLAPGAAVEIALGKHSIAVDGRQRVTFRWGEARRLTESGVPRELRFGRF